MAKQPAQLTRRTTAALLGSGLAMPALHAQTSILRFGLTPVFLDSDLALLRDLEAYLSGALGLPVQMVKRRTYQEVLALLLSRQIDAAWICGYPLVQHRSQIAALSVPLHRGRPLYQSYLIADAATSIGSLDDMRGHSHAFSDPDSNSGFLVTRWMLAERGTRPERWFSSSFFALGHRNVIRAVGTGLAASGSVDGYVWEVMAERETELTAQTRVVARSAWHGFPPICCLMEQRDAPLSQSLARALEGMKATPSGARILATLQLEGFIPADLALYEGIARMSDAVRRAG